MTRAVSVDQLLKKKFKTLDLSKPFADSLGVPESNGSWIIWADSGNGKTSYCMQLAKELAKFGKVVYNTLEEGARKSMQDAMIRHNMKEVSRNFQVLNRESMPDLIERLSKRKSPKFVFIDSLQYSGLTKAKYFKLVNDFPSKLFIFISHADGKQPDGRVARSVRYHCDVKTFIQGFKASSISRMGGGQDFIIWEQGASEYWGDIK